MKELVVPEVEAYAEAHSMPESDVCRRLREETYRSVELPQMVVGPLEGAFLKMMAMLVNAKRVLEIGTFTGYSALCFAEALPEEGTVLTCDIAAETTDVAKRHWAQSPAGRKIEARLGPAIETMQTLEGGFDVIFIDADKLNYVNYDEAQQPLYETGQPRQPYTPSRGPQRRLYDDPTSPLRPGQNPHFA